MTLLPEAFENRMKEMLGGEYEAFIKTYEENPRQALRLNDLKVGKDGESIACVYEKHPEVLPFSLSPVEWAVNGYYYEAKDQPGKHPFHEAGLYYIQEPSAMTPAGYLGVEPGDFVLDLCAAPGGKSTQLAAFLKGKGLLVSNEIHPTRAKILSENVERMGVKNVCVTNESADRLAMAFPVFFDKILVDAPCSGEGMFRKNPEAIEQWSPENVALCAERQQEILDYAAGMLRPGGRMVYSTCTFSKEENEEGIKAFLERHSEFHLIRQERLLPHKIEGEGHFLAVLTKEGSLEDGNYDRTAGLRGGKADLKGALKEAVTLWEEFAKETLKKEALEEFVPGTPDGEMQYLAFGENLYLTHTSLPSMKGLKVVRPGLQLGSVKKGRFEPSHALALALQPGQVLNVCDIPLEDTRAKAFINGETFGAEGAKGWHLVCIDGYSIGWGKLAGGIMKNHYPKGLRKRL